MVWKDTKEGLALLPLQGYFLLTSRFEHLKWRKSSEIAPDENQAEMKKLNFRYQFKSGKIDPEEKENQPQKFWPQPQRWIRYSRVISTTHVSQSVWPDIFSDSGNQKDKEENRQVLNLEENEEKKKNSQLTLRIYSQRPLKKKSKQQNKISLVTL